MSKSDRYKNFLFPIFPSILSISDLKSFDESHNAPDGSVRAFIEMAYDDAVPFLVPKLEELYDLEEINTDMKNNESEKLSSELPSLPFKTCWFESTSEAALSIFGTRMVDNTGRPDVELIAFLVTEIKPNVWGIAISELHHKNDKTSNCVSFFSVNPKLIETINDTDDLMINNRQLAMSKVIIKYLTCVISKIHDCQLGTEKIHRSFKAPTDRKPKNEKYVSHVIRIRPKHQKTATQPLFSREIEWNNSWIVRGHWRRHEGQTLGKDRNGERKVEGFTWVTDHKKGEGELIIKPRLLTAEQAKRV